MHFFFLLFWRYHPRPSVSDLARFARLALKVVGKKIDWPSVRFTSRLVDLQVTYLTKGTNLWISYFSREKSRRPTALPLEIQTPQKLGRKQQRKKTTDYCISYLPATWITQSDAELLSCKRTGSCMRQARDRCATMLVLLPSRAFPCWTLD